MHIFSTFISRLSLPHSIYHLTHIGLDNFEINWPLVLTVLFKKVRIESAHCWRGLLLLWAYYAKTNSSYPKSKCTLSTLSSTFLSIGIICFWSGQQKKSSTTCKALQASIIVQLDMLRQAAEVIKNWGLQQCICTKEFSWLIPDMPLQPIRCVGLCLSRAQEWLGKQHR